MIGAERADAIEHRDLPALEQTGEATVEHVDHTLLAGLGDTEVEHGFGGGETELRSGLDGPTHRCGLEQFLGGDASHMQTGPADLRLLDQRDAQTGGRAVEGCPVPGGTTTDDDDVELLGHLATSVRANPPSLPMPTEAGTVTCATAAVAAVRA